MRADDGPGRDAGHKRCGARAARASRSVRENAHAPAMPCGRRTVPPVVVGAVMRVGRDIRDGHGIMMQWVVPKTRSRKDSERGVSGTVERQCWWIHEQWFTRRDVASRRT